MKNDFTKINLFSCPIYKIRIDPNSYDKEKLLKDIKYNKSLKNTRNDTQYNFGNCDIHHSYKDFNNVNFITINYEKLTAAYLEIFKELFDKEICTTKELKFNFNIVNYSAVTEGQYLPSHNHLGDDDFSVIHYLNFKYDHIPTCFNNPAIFASYMQYIRPELMDTLDNSVQNSYLWESFSWKVKEDDMLIFPSALNHEIKAQGPTKEPRITISTNIKILSQEEKDERWTRQT